MLYKVFYTNKYIPERFAGVIYGPIILIRPEYRDDIGLLEHEKQHVRDFWYGFGIVYWLLYHLSKKWRRVYEVRGYAVQLRYNPEHILTYAIFLSTKYNLGITKGEAVIFLRKAMDNDRTY